MRRVTPLLIAVTSLLLAAEASAGTATYSSPPESEFSVRASNGYSIVVGSIRREVMLTALQRGKVFAFASYTVKGRASSRHIEASFGKLGRVSVRLETKRTKRNPPAKGCTGKVAVTRFGVFTGTIRFRGEDSYTTVDARRARGRTSTGFRETCSFSPLSRDSAVDTGRRHSPELTARAQPSRGFTARAFSKSSGVEKTVFEAGSFERRGRIEILRIVSTVGDRDSYVFANNLSSATVRPPSPFEGEATFQREGHRKTSWLGTLSVSFPGQRDVRLAGPGFSARLQPFEP